MTTRDHLDRLDALHAASTPGPWKHELHGRMSNVVQGNPWTVCGTGSDLERYAVEDAEFIAAAHEALPRLTAALRAVLELHTPCEFYPDDRYEEAGVPQIECNCCGDRWPCQTVTAITNALKERDIEAYEKRLSNATLISIERTVR